MPCAVGRPQRRSTTEVVDGCRCWSQSRGASTRRLNEGRRPKSSTAMCPVSHARPVLRCLNEGRRPKSSTVRDDDPRTLAYIDGPQRRSTTEVVDGTSSTRRRATTGSLNEGRRPKSSTAPMHRSQTTGRRSASTKVDDRSRRRSKTTSTKGTASLNEGRRPKSSTDHGSYGGVDRVRASTKVDDRSRRRPSPRTGPPKPPNGASTKVDDRSRRRSGGSHRRRVAVVTPQRRSTTEVVDGARVMSGAITFIEPQRRSTTGVVDGTIADLTSNYVEDSPQRRSTTEVVDGLYTTGVGL